MSLSYFSGFLYCNYPDITIPDAEKAVGADANCSENSTHLFALTAVNMFKRKICLKS
jgi:hypothetical protein